MGSVRNSAKAVIIRDGRILCTQNVDRLGVYYLLPGGGQERGETLVEALVRECREEISAEVTVRELLFVREYLAAHQEIEQPDPDFHQVEFMFSCSIHDTASLCEPGNAPDPTQVGVEWLPLDRLGEYRFYPKALIAILMDMGQVEIPEHPVYLGDVN